MQRRCTLQRPSDTTLIMCPSHLVDQWEGELWKFLGANGPQILKPRPAGFIQQSAQTLTRVFEWQYGPDRDLGIRVKKAPSSWSEKGDLAIITDIKPHRQRQFAQKFGLEDAIQHGDVITRVEFMNLRKPNGDTVHRVVKTRFTDVARALEEGTVSCKTRVRETVLLSCGMIPDDPGRPVEEYLPPAYVALSPAEDSTVTLTLMRPSAEAQR
uniref:SNF2 N-terminal domain-containing protein n=1 Tax=Eutreptiella gymnastica TaxID=73025 RepID=A0A7S4G3A1_9EUGL